MQESLKPVLREGLAGVLGLLETAQTAAKGWLSENKSCS